jgi:hypothetical protein
LPRLASNLDPPDLCLLSSWDYRVSRPCPCSLKEAFSICSPILIFEFYKKKKKKEDPINWTAGWGSITEDNSSVLQTRRQKMVHICVWCEVSSKNTQDKNTEGCLGSLSPGSRDRPLGRQGQSLQQKGTFLTIIRGFCYFVLHCWGRNPGPLLCQTLYR